MPTEIPCQIEGCKAVIKHELTEVALAMYSSHAQNHERAVKRDEPQRDNAPKLDRPRISRNATEEAWNVFVAKWNIFKECSSMHESTATAQLIQCCDDDVADDILKEDPGIVKGSVKDLLASIKRIAVVPVAKSVKRAELFSLKQRVDEPVRSFYARVKGKAETCGFSSKCCCKRMIVKDITIAGLADIDIRRDA
ncbi:Hypothetical protein FKW44_005905 [Caligus rogercresseyi]|uniref:Uncharacterized protein n=1 Tax=Caligus rogercresseyi TaxID=217165 RepID=A0A7T8KCN4_CALRO|nr:Hypothetical protein FKW44_005905 [Caligus rogercresseyi]